MSFVKRAMSPRLYELGRRRASSAATRARILAAARALLVAGDGFGGFTVDAVARQAGVARMTVYYQFESKRGLLEALCDSLALEGGMERLPEAFREPRPDAALAELIGAFSHLWAMDRPLMRRLQALAALDGDFGQVIEARNRRRREALQVLLRRMRVTPGQPERPLQPALDLLVSLTSFETFDGLATSERSAEKTAALIQHLARAALVLDGP